MPRSSSPKQHMATVTGLRSFMKDENWSTVLKMSTVLLLIQNFRKIGEIVLAVTRKQKEVH